MLWPTLLTTAVAKTTMASRSTSAHLGRKNLPGFRHDQHIPGVFVRIAIELSKGTRAEPSKNGDFGTRSSSRGKKYRIW